MSEFLLSVSIYGQIDLCQSPMGDQWRGRTHFNKCIKIEDIEEDEMVAVIYDTNPTYKQR